MKISELTLDAIASPGALDGSLFLDLYSKCLAGAPLERTESIELLRFAVLFLNAGDTLLHKFAYRIALEYAVTQMDPTPLHAIARGLDLTPVAIAAEATEPALSADLGPITDLEAAHRTNFAVETPNGVGSMRTRGQMSLRARAASARRALVLAPTSYGKSEMLVDRVAASVGRRVVVLTPTRALLSQTRLAVVQHPAIRASVTPVFTHHDGYAGFDRFVAVLTQERLKRLLIRHRDLRIDVLLVDEAHKLLESGSRSRELAEVVAILEKRNEDLESFYFSPFVSEPPALELGVGPSRQRETVSTNEQVKAERYIVARPGEEQHLYDQFLDHFIGLSDRTPEDLPQTIAGIPGSRLLVYVNTPPAAERAARMISSVPQGVGEARLASAARAVRQLVHKRYILADTLGNGVVFHHGSVPDGVRDYVEDVFRNSPLGARRVLVSTSTLLEGVNTPTDTLVMLSGSQGNRNMSTAAFRNLVGRAGRLNEAFAAGRENLAMLRPSVYLVPGHSPRFNWNAESFLRDRARVSAVAETPATNPLLVGAPRDEARAVAVDRLENLEPGSTGESPRRRPRTDVGRLCIENGIDDFDVFEHEERIQRRLEFVKQAKSVVSVSLAVDALFDIFLAGITPMPEALRRIRDNGPARDFYKMFIAWRSEGMTLREMVARNLTHWKKSPNALVYVGDQWGEEAYGGGTRRAWVRMAEKTTSERVGLAVAKIKAEQEFVENRLAKYFETMHQLGVLSEELYFTIRYGTSDPYLICLLRNGFSPELARLIQADYPDLVEVMTSINRVFVRAELIVQMHDVGENPILIHEARTRCDEPLPTLAD